MPKRGLPGTMTMRHDEHYVEALAASAGTPVGRLIPIQSSYFALEGTDDLLETIEKVRARANPTLRILGVVMAMHDKRTALGRDIRA